MNHNKNCAIISISEKQSDIEIAMDLVGKYYLIKDSIFVRFQRKAKETLLQKTNNVIHTITHPVARRLLMMIIKQ
jgi:hypothetical protein